MKKILSVLTTLGIISPTVASVVACGPRISNNVLFILPGNTMSSASRITRSYQQIVRDFNNSEEMKGSKVKVEVGWESGDPIQLRASVLEQLPDLYIAYPDVAAKYILDPTKTASARNMEETYFGNDELKDASLKEKFWSEAFYSEGLINNDLYVLPLNKSFDMSIINLRIFLELTSFVDQNIANTIGDGLKAENYGNLASHLFLKNGVVDDTELLNNLKPALEKISQSNKKTLAIREFFKFNNNVINLAKLYSNLYRNHLNRDTISDYTNDQRKMFPIGIDSIANKVFMEYGDALNPEGVVQTIDPYKKNGNFFYEIENMNPDRERMDILLDNPESKIFKEVNNYFNTLRDLTSSDPSIRKHSDMSIRWSGSMLVGKLDGKTYTSDFFNQGSMLVTSSSTAGSWSFKAKKNQFDRDKDLLVVSSSTATGNNFNFIQQGPGLAGFKSVGKNAKEKEIITTKFVRYLLQPKVQNKLAIMSGYIPSTSDALDFFKFYKDGSFNNKTGEWKEGITKPSNAEEFEKVYDPNRTIANPQDDILISQLLNDFIISKKMNAVTAVGNPAGAIIRTALDQALKMGFFRNFESFDQILKSENRNARWAISGQFYGILPGTLGSSKIKVKSK